MRSLWHGTRSRRGSTIVIMSVMLFSMLALAALAIDLGFLRRRAKRGAAAADAVPGRRRSLPGLSLD